MKSFLFVLLILSSLLVTSQVPQRFNYQAVARNSNGSFISNQFISVQIIIYDGSPSGTIVYQETDTASTNQFGLFTVAIGTGQVQVGPNLAAINWATGNKYLQVGFNSNGSLTNFTDMGTTELLSVPYALYAANSGSNATVADYAVYSEMQVNAVAPQTELIDSTLQPRQLNHSDVSAGTSITRNGYYITLQPGIFHISASAQWGISTNPPAGVSQYEIARSFLEITDTANNILLLGQAQLQCIPSIVTPINSPVESYSSGIEGIVTISKTTTVTLQQYINYTYTNGVTITANAGIPMGIGLNEVYARLLIQKIN